MLPKKEEGNRNKLDRNDPEFRRRAIDAGLDPDDPNIDWGDIWLAEERKKAREGVLVGAPG